MRFLPGNLSLANANAASALLKTTPAVDSRLTLKLLKTKRPNGMTTNISV